MKKKSLIYLLSLMVIATLFLFSACFRLEPSFTVELETTRELIPVLNLSEYSLTVTVGEGSYVELSADTGLVSEMKVAIAGGKAEIARLFTESSAKELTVSVKNASGNEIAKKTIALAGKEAEFAVADLATDGIYIPEEPAEGEPLEFYSLDCIRGKTTPERIVILLDLEDRGGYILLAGYGWTWEDYLVWLEAGSPDPEEAASLLPTHRAIDKCDGDKLFNAVTGKYIYVLTMSKQDLKPGVGDSGTTDPALGAHEFDEGTIVDLEAFPGENWLFMEWQGDVVGSTVLIDGDKEVTAVFTPIEHLLEIVNYFPQGGNVDVAAENVALDNLPMVPQGAELILTAVPSKNWRFVSWELPYDHSTKNPEYFTMSAPATLKVYFAPIEGKYPLTVGKIGTGEGNTTPVPGIYNFNPGAEVPLTASAASGSRFDRWFVDGLGQAEGEESIVVTIDGTTTAMANFIKLWTLNVDKVGEGTTDPEPGSYILDMGTEKTLTAKATAGWRFDRWEVDGVPVEDEDGLITITVNADTQATAYFIKQWEVIVDKVGEGTTAPESGIYDDGTLLTFVATPADGWRFDRWVINGEEFLTEEVANYPIVEDTLATAHFIKQYTLTVNVIGEGTTDPEEGTHIYDVDTVVPLEASEAFGWKFDKWVVNGNETTDNPTEVLINADSEATAVFTQLKPEVVVLDAPKYACGTKKFTVLVSITYADDVKFEFEDGTTTIIYVEEINGTKIYEVEVEAPSVPGPIPVIKALTVTASNEAGETIVSKPVSVLENDHTPPEIGDFYADPEVGCDATGTTLFFDFFCDPCKDDVDFWDFEKNGRIEVSHGYVDWETLDAPQYIEDGRCGYKGEVEWVFEDIDCETVMATVTIRDYCGNESQSGLDNGPLGPVDNVYPGLISFEQIGGFDCDDPEIVFEFSIEENCLCEEEVELVFNCACDWEYELSDPATKLGENGRIVTTYTATVTMLAREDCTDYSFKLLFADCCGHDGESEWITVSKDLRAPRIMMHGFLSSDLYTPSLNTIGDMVISVIGIINPITKEFLDIDLFEDVLPINLNDILGSFQSVMDNIDLVPMDQASIINAELEDLISMVEDYLMPCNADQGYYTWMVWDDCLKETEILYSDTICNTGKKVEEETQPGYLVGYQRVELCGLDCETIQATLTAYDECGNKSEADASKSIDNEAPVIIDDFFVDYDECTDIATISWDATDGSGEVLVVIAADWGTDGSSDTILDAATPTGQIVWDIPDINGEWVTMTMWVFDRCDDCTRVCIDIEEGWLIEGCLGINMSKATQEIFVDNVSPEATFTLTGSCTDTELLVDYEIYEGNLAEFELLFEVFDSLDSTVVASEVRSYVDPQLLGAFADLEYDPDTLTWTGSETFDVDGLDCQLVRVTLTATDNCGNVDSVSEETTIDNVVPKFEWSVVGVDEGGCITAAPVSLTWLATDGSNSYEITIQASWTGGVQRANKTSDKKSGTLSFRNFDLDCVDVEFIFTIRDGCSDCGYTNVATESKFYKGDTQAPKVELDAEISDCATEVAFDWAATDTCLYEVALYLWLEDCLTGETTLLDTLVATGTYDFSLLTIEGTVTAILTATDTCGNSATDSVAFKVDTIAPRIDVDIYLDGVPVVDDEIGCFNASNTTITFVATATDCCLFGYDWGYLPGNIAYYFTADSTVLTVSATQFAIIVDFIWNDATDTICPVTVTAAATDCCGNDSVWGTEFCFDTVLPGLDNFTFNSKTQVVKVDFDEDVEVSDDATAALYVWLDPQNAPTGGDVTDPDFSDSVKWQLKADYDSSAITPYTETIKDSDIAVSAESGTPYYQLQGGVWYGLSLNGIVDKCGNPAGEINIVGLAFDHAPAPAF